jgi:excisionase family DNA binding protein
MTADEVAAFLGVDRNTVYDYANRGVIPHQRLGKRTLFRRGALVSWLDSACKATSTRKG